MDTMMNGNAYPATDDYEFALKRPPGKRRFKAGKGREILEALDQGEVVAPAGLPYLHKGVGAYAAVYQIRTGDGTWALRCPLKRLPDGAAAHYRAVSDFQKKARTPLLAPCDHFEDALYVATGTGGRYYPVTAMAWVPGRTLLTETRRRAKARDRAGLARLAERWEAAMREKERLGFTHGDLHGDNWHVLPQGDDLCAVDYDTMVPPGMALPKGGAPWCEGYVHPCYTRDGKNRPYDTRMDEFGALVILVGLRALAGEPDLLDRWKRDEWLLTREDVEDPDGSEALDHLCRSRGRGVAAVADALRAECREPEETYTLRVTDFTSGAALAARMVAVPSSFMPAAKMTASAPSFGALPSSVRAATPTPFPVRFTDLPASVKGGRP